MTRITAVVLTTVMASPVSLIESGMAQSVAPAQDGPSQAAQTTIGPDTAGTTRRGQTVRPAISATTAARHVAQNAVTLVDVRRPAEWRQSGVAKPAFTVTMHQPVPRFLARLQELRGLGRPIVLICATGGRTAFLQSVLAKQGMPVSHVRDGMMGNAAGPGWISSGLPLRRLQPQQP